MIYVLMARDAPRAVIFRRGPTRQVLLLSWNLETDEIEEGQWLKGRIYERRCHLSPDGKLLIYFAAKYKLPLASWTAISKPPYLTALALWPKGDGWGGGGLFETRRRIALNHRPAEMYLADGFRMPKRHPLAPERYMLQMSITGIRERDHQWYRTEHSVAGSHALGRSDWADWTPTGDLLFAQGMSLYRLTYARGELAPLAEAREIVNLAGATFAEREAPPEARRWISC